MPGSADAQHDLTAATYVALTSYRRDGTPVATPVWVVGDGAGVAVWTPRDSYKVKRIRRNPAVTVAPCTFRGEPLGPAVSGHAEIMDAAGLARVRQAIRRKYGLMGRLTLAGSRLRRGVEGTVAIKVTVEGAQPGEAGAPSGK